MDPSGGVRSYREQVLNVVSLIAAIATARADPNSPLTDLAERQDLQLHDLLHDFAFRARKLIELADRAGIPVKELAHQRSVLKTTADNSELGAEEHDDIFGSLWFVLGRIIHSDSLVIQRAAVQLDGDNPHISHSLPWGFEVASDRDSTRGVTHFVFIEFLLTEYLRIDAVIDRELSVPEVARGWSGETLRHSYE